MNEPVHGYTDDELRRVLESVQTIAVIGMSTDPTKAAHRIPKMLIEAGYTVIPVNPSAQEILGQKSYARLNDIPFPVDLVDVFRPGPKTPEYAEKAAKQGAKVLWLQLGITNPKTRELAEGFGLEYFENVCTGEVVRRLGIQAPGTPQAPTN